MPRRATGLVIGIAIVTACTEPPPPELPQVCLDTKTGYDRACRAIWLEPIPGDPGSIVLIGDSLPIRMLTDSGLVASTWTLGGPALGHANVSSARPTSHWVKALALGTATVTANAQGRVASTTITVVDSAAIVSLTAPATYTEISRAGAAWVPIAMRDAAGREIAANATWTASSNIVTIEPQLYSIADFFAPGAYVRFNGVGTVTLTARYRGLSAETRLTILP